MAAKIRTNADGSVSILNGTTEAISVNTDGEVTHPAADVSFGTNGYAWMPNGMLMQWGYKPDTGGGMYVDYPIAFPNAVFTVQCQMVYNAANYQNTTIATSYATSLTQFYVRWDSVASGITWLAIGH